jgi:hypothetical protein
MPRGIEDLSNVVNIYSFAMEIFGLHFSELGGDFSLIVLD